MINIFSKSLDYTFCEVIGQGLDSTVLRVWNKNATNGFAMRIVLTEDVGPKEKKWSQLRHKNLLTLLDSESFPTFDFT